MVFWSLRIAQELHEARLPSFWVCFGSTRKSHGVPVAEELHEASQPVVHALLVLCW